MQCCAAVKHNTRCCVRKAAEVRTSSDCMPSSVGMPRIKTTRLGRGTARREGRTGALAAAVARTLTVLWTEVPAQGRRASAMLAGSLKERENRESESWAHGRWQWKGHRQTL
jgi:hypothetical protein